MTKGLNMQAVKSENRSLVLYLLNEYGRLSRKDISSKLGLTPAGVTKICNELIKQGYILETGLSDAESRMGRKEILLELNLSTKYVLGVNADKDKITYSISSLDGKLVKSYSSGLTLNIERIVAEASNFLYNSNIDISSFIAVGICTIGSGNNYGIWNNAELEKAFVEKLSLPVIIENNVKAFAYSELIYGEQKNESSVMFFKWGPGIGSSIVANGRVQSGSDTGVAEIGHYIVDSGGKRCRCGRYGCLETVASVDAIMDEIGTQNTIDEIIFSQDSSVVCVIDQKIDIVALALTNMATILDTNNIVLFGAMFKNEQIAQKLKKQCIRYNKNFSDDVVNISALNDKSDYIGTTAICAKKLFFEREG